MNYDIASVGGVLKSRQMFFINSRCAQEASDLAQEFKTFIVYRQEKLIANRHKIISAKLVRNLQSAVYFSNHNTYLGRFNAAVITTLIQNKCPDPGLNRGPLDLQSNVLPIELSRQ